MLRGDPNFLDHPFSETTRLYKYDRERLKGLPEHHEKRKISKQPTQFKADMKMKYKSEAYPWIVAAGARANVRLCVYECM